MGRAIRMLKTVNDDEIFFVCNIIIIADHPWYKERH